jgi:nucleoside-diphosphate-sugar epimerase
MAKILLIGCGSLGTMIANNLHLAGHQVVGVRKSAQALPHAMQTIQADVTQAESLSTLAEMYAQIVIYCISAGATSDEDYYQHYVLGLSNVLATQRDNTKLERVFFVSSSSVYGDDTQNVIDETSPTLTPNYNGKRMLQAEQLLTQLACPYTVLRLSGIYGTGRLYLLNMAKDITRWPQQNSWSNRIHQQDAAAFIAYLVNLHEQQPLQSCYIVTDDMPTQQYEVLMWLAQQLHVPVPELNIPSISHGKRLSNRRLRDTGFILKYANYQSGYSEIIKAIL